MPGPFPGMDPYLESPAYWRSLHGGFIFCLAATLNAQLPLEYSAFSEERLYIIEPEHTIIPDLTVFRQPKAGREALQNRGGIAVADASDSPVMVTIFPEEIREPYIEIRYGKNPGRVVTVIEVLSPSNKAQGSPGREEYLKKQQAVLNSNVNLLEIDLLRTGAYTVSVPREAVRQYIEWDYLICLHRGSQRYSYEFWPNSMRSRLPRAKAPLEGDDDDILLDLQQAYDAAYDGGPYRRAVDYQAEPEVPLSSEDAPWADNLLREKGLRT